MLMCAYPMPSENSPGASSDLPSVAVVDDHVLGGRSDGGASSCALARSPSAMHVATANATWHTKRRKVSASAFIACLPVGCPLVASPHTQHDTAMQGWQ
jgi:hypothetical protein